MFESIKQFLSELAEGESYSSRFDDSDYRLAAAALLVHTATIDGKTSPAERERLHAIVKRRFALDDATADELLREAKEVEQDAVDLYHFTSVLMRVLDYEGRCRVVEMMWQVVYADGRVSEFEENLIWRAADLLGISGRVRIELKHKVAAAQSTADEPS